MKTNNRINKVEEYHFKRIEELKNNLLKEKKEVIDLSIGDPDLKVNTKITKELVKALRAEGFNKYPPYEGLDTLKHQIIKYYEEIYSVSLKSDEVVILIGSKEGLSGIIPAVCDIGDNVITPMLGYPVYETCSKLWGCTNYNIKLTEENSYLPNLSVIPKSILEKSKLFFINYPNNPTGAIANEDFYKEIISFCDKWNIILCNDGAYNEIINPFETPISLLQFDKKKNCVEFGTFSKIYNMTGFRLGYAVGNKAVISAISKIKSNLDSGQFIPIQKAGIEALKLDRDYVNSIRLIYQGRKTAAENILKQKNIDFFSKGRTFYLWCKTPQKFTTDEFCEQLINNYGIVVTPGYCFGESGKEYFRIALTKSEEVINKCLIKLDIY